MKKTCAARPDSSIAVSEVSLFNPPASWRNLALPEYAGTVCIPFYTDGAPIDAHPAHHGKALPHAFLSLKAAGSMRFRWNERNENRERYIRENGFSGHIAQTELIHSQNVFFVSAPADTDNLQGDGILTPDKTIVPTVTAADCMPVYLFDPETGIFGVVHSGWRGTGIAAQAVQLAAEKTGARPEHMLVILGPHIHSCCYTVDKVRAEYFKNTFTPDCIAASAAAGAHIKQALPDDGFPFRLSLARANIASLTAAGVLPEHILHCTDCTCCDQRLGSFRRETAGLPAQMSATEKSYRFTPMAAYCKF